MTRKLSKKTIYLTVAAGVMAVCIMVFVGVFALGPQRGELTVDGTFRHRELAPDGAWSLGFQFVGLETSPEGQELLVRIARIVTDFQRAAARRRQPRLRSRRYTR